MPKRSNQRRRRNRRIRTTRRRPNNGARGSPSIAPIAAPKTTAFLRSPLFPISVRKRGMLYYEPALGLTAPNTGAAVTYFFTANGMYDPNVTGTGHQPLGFDQMMLMYEQCTVLNSSIQVTFNMGPGLTVEAGVYLSPDAVALTDAKQLVENGLVKFIPLTSGSSTFQNQHMRTTVRMSCDVAKYFGRRGRRSILNDDNLYTTTAANPAEQVYYGITAWQISPDASTTTSIGFDVLLSYDVVFWEPRKLTES